MSKVLFFSVFLFSVFANTARADYGIGTPSDSCMGDVEGVAKSYVERKGYRDCVAQGSPSFQASGVSEDMVTLNFECGGDQIQVIMDAYGDGSGDCSVHHVHF
jgi:hypothetical protein